MARYKESDYSIQKALENIGDYFWRLFRDDLYIYASDRTRRDVFERIHSEWDNPPMLNPVGTDIRIEWAIAIYDHGDWEKSLSFEVPSYKTNNQTTSLADPRRKYPAEYRCDNGVYVRSISELCIANWFYYNQVPFEYERQVVFSKGSEVAHCDFYLLEKDIYIEYWGMTNDSSYSEYKQWKEPLYAQNGLKLISLHPADLKNLGDKLRKVIAESKCIGEIRRKATMLKVEPEIRVDMNLKIGQLANTVLREVLEREAISKLELEYLQEWDYCKDNFDIQYPLITEAKGQKHPLHYYAKPLDIYGKKYYLCCEWYENAANNDRPYLIKWLKNHGVDSEA